MGTKITDTNTNTNTDADTDTDTDIDTDIDTDTNTNTDADTDIDADKTCYYLVFSYFYGIGPMRFSSLIKHFSNAKEAYEAKEQELSRIIGRNLAEKFVKFRNTFDPVKKLEEMRRKEISVVTISSSAYPKALKEIPDPPICLYAKGSIKLFCDSAAESSNNGPILFAIVGTRTPTLYGQQIARKFASELTEAGFIIVSGMALGIDSIAHRVALSEGGITIAVLGCGVDVIYPAANRNLYYKIIEKGGLIISEFPPGQFIEKGLFVARNRIISGLSKGVLIVEGLKDSGALITARHAAEQGKEVFAPPGPITSPLSQAPHLLLKQGAKLVTSVEDIYEELGLQLVPKKKQEIELQLNEVEKTIFRALQKEPLLVDEIAAQLNNPVSQILDAISILEIKGVVEKNSEGKYQAKI